MKTLILLLAFASTVHATEAPGCGNQHYRPRLSQCCPKFLVGEALPPKCTLALASGFLRQCCGETTQPTPEPTPTDGRCWSCDWWQCTEVPCEDSTPEPCLSPTPLPTPEHHQKGACCKDVLRIYRSAREAIVRQKQQELRALTAWKLEQMKVCREGY
jgi:hypothetical protein